MVDVEKVNQIGLYTARALGGLNKASLTQPGDLPEGSMCPYSGYIGRKVPIWGLLSSQSIYYGYMDASG